MREQSFGARQGLHIAGKAAKTAGLIVCTLMRFTKSLGGKAAAPPRPAAGRQNVIAAAGVIAKGLRAERPEKIVPAD